MDFVHENKIIDVVIPLILADIIGPNNKGGKEVSYSRLFGTGFLIGNRGFGLTCAHVIDQLFDGKREDQMIVTQFHYKGRRFPFHIEKYEKHPTQDVAIFKVDHDSSLKSCLEIEKVHAVSSTIYHAWGYPFESANELKKLDADANEEPVIIFTEGYVRRRIDRELYPTFLYRGNCFYELSDLGGHGYSGSPIIERNSVGRDRWKIFGMYVGEHSGEGPSVGYAVNSQCFFDWAPDILGKSVMEESQISLVRIESQSDLKT